MDRKAFISINLKDLLLLEVQELEKENKLALSDSDYTLFKSLNSLQEKVTWLLNHDSRLKGFYEQVRITCQYASRRDVFILHGEYFLDPNLYEEAQVRISALSHFLTSSSKREEGRSDESLKILVPSSEFQYQTGAWKDVFNDELETLFSKKLGHYQAKLGY